MPEAKKYITENLESMILKHAPDIVAITEFWLTPDVFNHEIAPSNYSVIRKGRLSRVGGVAVLIKNTIPFIPLPAIADAEPVFSLIICNDLTIFTSCFYRSPQSGPESVIALQNFMQNLSTIHELFKSVILASRNLTGLPCTTHFLDQAR